MYCICQYTIHKFIFLMHNLLPHVCVSTNMKLLSLWFHLDTCVEASYALYVRDMTLVALFFFSVWGLGPYVSRVSQGDRGEFSFERTPFLPF